MVCPTEPCGKSSFKKCLVYHKLTSANQINFFPFSPATFCSLKPYHNAMTTLSFVQNNTSVHCSNWEYILGCIYPLTLVKHPCLLGLPLLIAYLYAGLCK